jgi:hypothetical protein
MRTKDELLTGEDVTVGITRREVKRRREELKKKRRKQPSRESACHIANVLNVTEFSVGPGTDTGPALARLSPRALWRTVALGFIRQVHQPRIAADTIGWTIWCSECNYERLACLVYRVSRLAMYVKLESKTSGAESE